MPWLVSHYFKNKLSTTLCIHKTSQTTSANDTQKHPLEKSQKNLRS